MVAIRTWLSPAPGRTQPASIPAVEAVWRRRLEEILAEPGAMERMLGHYDPPRGNPRFVEAVAGLLRSSFGWDVTPEHVAVTVGGQTAFFMLFNLLVLLVAAGIMIAIGEPTDAIVIGAIVILNAAIGFVQEYRAEQAMAALRTMTAPNARVVRDGAESTVEASTLVPGDLLILDAGDLDADDFSEFSVSHGTSTSGAGLGLVARPQSMCSPAGQLKCDSGQTARSGAARGETRGQLR